MTHPHPRSRTDTYNHTRSRHAHEENVFLNVSCVCVSFFVIFQKFKKVFKSLKVSFPELWAEFFF